MEGREATPARVAGCLGEPSLGGIRHHRDAVSVLYGLPCAPIPSLRTSKQPFHRTRRGFRAFANIEHIGAASIAPPKETPREFAHVISGVMSAAGASA